MRSILEGNADCVVLISEFVSAEQSNESYI